jgi:osmoprotectant transport system permease protein
VNAALAAMALASAGAGTTVHVGSKNFAESHLLGEIFAQAIEARGVKVERNFGLGGSLVAFQALEAGALDVYPEYDGTALLVLLKEPLDPPGNGPRRAARDIGTRTAEGMAARGIAWLAPLGFSDDWVLAMPAQIAGREDIRSLSDLASASGRGVRLAGGFSAEFLDREDGLHGLERAYGFKLAEPRPMSEPLKYTAVADGEITLLDASSTDARLESLHLTGLADDRHFFPSYQCAPLARADLATRAPRAQAALVSLAGGIDLATMRRMNGLVLQGASDAQVARDFLRSQGLVTDVAAASGREPTRQGLLDFLAEKRGYLGRLLLRHLELTFGALVAASWIGLALGLLASRRPLAEAVILKVVGIAQTIPGLPLLAFLVPWLGIGVWPSLVALFIYALLPIVQSTYAGLTSVDPDLIWVATGQGMTDRQVTRWIRFPLAAPVAMSGIRVAAVTTVGNATLAAFVGGGGLGEPILSGLTLNDTRLILLGAVPAAMLALAMDVALGWLAKRLAPQR